MGKVGRRSKREGIYVHRLLIHVVVQQKPTQHCKTIILKLKKKISGTNQRRKERPRRAKDTEGEKEGQEGDEKEAGMGNRTQANATSILQGLYPGQE